ncbi:Alpha-N-arabinofuranosidase [Melioribacter roseus P3M-2]|uniref:Alpha-N-arabinofuranosidase n=1 Tax=Melioribacter roseus (strain DSM 23840 / JCM 17771 / VKM B-2668 / P3M-2) TaxID=1191523 RepID=I7A273_MELRP|nr:glycoside hydrolase family 43 protein [Melioribacter roseus]AFN75323.1 Alpha-N-arabinofuranosidase [Melioribacter roseus P3M-2]
MKKYFLLLFLTFCVYNAQEKYSNPILMGFYPDPSICKVEDNYYLVNSSFAYFPGIPVFQSKDLVNWKLIGHVLDRKEQMNTNGLGVSRGVFAPSIRYHNGLFYVTCTLVDAGGNFIVTAKDPAGPWSNPVWIPEINGIDPSPFFDDDGKAYIVYNSVAPDNKPLYDGHRTIRIYELDLDSLKVRGDEHILVNGGTDLSKRPIWIEGPHIFKKDGYYFLIAAEGGTGDNHSEVVFRSKNLLGPYEPYAKNPILTQRHLDPNRKNPITSTGHADFVVTDGGDWWAVFLGCRPYDNGYYNTGRETFLAPVKWIDGWPVINPDYEEVQYFYPYPAKPAKEFAERKYSGNFIIVDEFDEDELSGDWIYLRTPEEKWHSLKEKEGFLRINLRPETCSGNGNPSFIGHRQQHIKCSAETKLNFSPESEFEKAGLVIFQNEKHFYYLCKSKNKLNDRVQLFKSTSGNELELIEEAIVPAELRSEDIRLKIVSEGKEYSFHYAWNEGEWNTFLNKLDASFLSTKVAGGFVGAVFGLYATSSGKISSNKAFYDYFIYRGNDDIFNKNE